jgi:hypothetical protein
MSRCKEIEMKEKIMKLSVLMGIPVLAVFIMAGVASAFLPFPYIPYLHGVYAVTGLDTCEPGAGMMEGFYTFKYDGTGSMSGTVRRFPDLSPTGNPFPVMTLSAKFEYTVTKEGKIEFDYSGLGGLKVEAVYGPDMKAIDPPMYLMTLSAGPSHGFISPDRSMITISCGPPWSLKILDAPPEAPPMLCITSLTGMRIK